MFAKIEEMIKTHPVMVFIKGSALEPFCKFSKELLQHLKPLGIEFGYYDILADESMRHWLRYYDKWPT